MVGHSRPCPFRPSTSFSHTQLSHTQLPHTQLSHTQPYHTQPYHTQLAHTQLSYTQLSHTQTLCGRRPAYGTGLALVARLVPVSRRGCLSGGCGTWKHPHSVWQAWHLATSTFTLWQAWQFWHWAGSCGALGSRCRRGCLSHLDASTSIQCGRCGTWRHRNSLCVAGVALMALGWLWWRV